MLRFQVSLRPVLRMLLCLSFLGTLSQRPLQALPTVALQNLPGDVLVGEVFHFKLLFKADPILTGFGPFIELAVQHQGADCTDLSGPCDGLSLVSASAVFANGTVPLTACTAVAPDSLSSLCSTPPVGQCTGTSSTPAPSGCYFGIPPVLAGFQKSVLLLPFGSFVPGQPDVEIDVAVRVHAFADVNAPLLMHARGGFRYGTNALGTSPPIVGPAVSASVTAHVLRVRKLYLGPEDETATGPNFPRQYTIEVDIADGQTLDNVEIEDCFPANLKFLSLASASPVPTGPAVVSGQCVMVPFGILTGGPGGAEASASFNFFVPELDASSQPVLGQSCLATSLDQGTASGGWQPTDTRDTFVNDIVTATHTLSDKCLALQKSVTIAVDTGAVGPTPGDILQYTLDFQVSDFRTIRNLVVDDFLGDGQTLLTSPQAPALTIRDRFGGSFTGNFVSGLTFSQAVVPSAPCQAADPTVQPQRLRFQVSPQLALLNPIHPRHLLGILTGGHASLPIAAIPATGRIVFQARIDDKYQRQPAALEPFVDKDDPLLNCATATAQVLANVSFPAIPFSVLGNTADSSATEVRIIVGQLNKTVFAINGNTTVPPSPKVSPGDLVTFRIQYPIPSSDFEQLKVVDYSPLPALPIVPTFALLSCGPPIPPVAKASSLGPFCSLPGLLLTGPPNSLTFNYGDFNLPANTPGAVDLRYTVQVSPAPFVDGLQLTNEAYETESNTFGKTSAQAAIAQVTLCEPKLHIRKGVVSTNKPGAVFLPSPPAPAGVTFGAPGTSTSFTGVIRSSNVASALFSDVTNVDGCDVVRYAIVIENLGCAKKGAFDVKLRDLVPSCLASRVNLQARRGNGIPFTCNGGQSCASQLGGFFGAAGITLDDVGGVGALAAFSPSSGTNIAVITFDAQIGCQVAATGCCTNQARLLNYAGVEGGPNHVSAGFSTPFPGAVGPFVDEARVCVQPALSKSIVTTSEGHTGNVGGSEQLAIGEIITYKLDVTIPEGTSPAMTVNDALPAGLQWLAPCTITKSPSVNTPTQNLVLSGPSLTLTLGNVTNFANTPAPEKLTIVCKALVLNSSANVNLTPKPNSFSVKVQGVTYTSNVVQAVIVEPAGVLVKKDLGSQIAGTTVYQLTFSNTGTSTAFDVVVQDNLPSPLTLTGPVQVSGGVLCTTTTPPGQVKVACAMVPAGGTLTIQFTVTGVPLCGSVLNLAQLTYTSLPGLKGTGNVTPGASGAPNGERIYSNSANVLTDPKACKLVAIAAGGVHSLALRDNGTITAWGNNSAGQLGNGATVNSTVPVDVNGLTSVTAIAGGNAHSLALRQDGTVWAWGRGDLGQLGNGVNAHSSVPLQVPGLSGVTAVAGGSYHSLALTGGIIRAWGENGSGVLGNGSTISSNVPVQVSGLSNVIAIAGGAGHALALRNDGTVWAWGGNGVGQLGIGSVTVSSLVPVQVKGPGNVGFLTNVAAISAGFNHSLARRNDGTIVAWGANQYGQLGNGSNTDSSAPVQVAGLSGALSISAGGDHSLAVLSGGAVRAWGRNSFGQLGIGATAFSSNLPLAVSGLGVVQAVAGGDEHSLTLEDAGTAVHAWGYNSSGQLGDGTTVDRRSPVIVKVPCPHCALPPANMTAWWTFDETAGTTASDRAGAPNDGAHLQGPTPAPGKVAGALCFDGVNDRVEAPDHPELDVDTGDFTIDTWVRTTAGSGIITLVDKRDLAPSERGYTFFLFNGRLFLQMATGIGSGICSNSPADGCTNFGISGPSIADGQWHHVAVTVDRDDTQGGIFYIDGQPVPGTFNPTFRPQSLGNGATARIAAHSFGGGFLQGCLDELEIFQRELSAAEIKAIFAAGSSGKCKC